MMQLTRQAQIAVDVLVLCARSCGAGPVTTRMAARFAGTTKNHAARIVSHLSRAGLLESTRGRGGGIRLGRAAAQISVGAAIRAVEPAFGEPPSSGDGCRGHAFDAVQRAALRSYVSLFDAFTIADLAATDAGGGRLGCLDCSLHALYRQAPVLAQLAGRGAGGISRAA